MENFGILSLLPPIVAIALCIITRQVIVSLSIGAFVGIIVLVGGNPIIAFANIITTISDTVGNSWNVSILLFTFLLGGYIALLGKSGGMQAIARRAVKFITSRSRGTLVTCLFSTLLFFSDYTSMILTGVVMRPITDRLRISREKLSYIVAGCGTGITALSPISGWTAYQVAIIGTAVAAVGMNEGAYTLFVKSIPYRFYGIFSVAFIYFISMQNRDFGKMYEAEKRAITTGHTFRPDSTPMGGIDDKEYCAPEGSPERAINFFAPMITMFVIMFIGFFITGGGTEKMATEGLLSVFASASTLWMMTVGVLAATIILGIMMLAQKMMTFSEINDTWIGGMKSLVFTIVFMVLAWTLANVCKSLGTANYIVTALVESNFPGWTLPTIVFIISGLMGFATGSSWGTMALVMPLAIPAAAGLGAPVLATIGAVFTASTMGDHISPISESVVLSSMASGVDHMDHCMTQLPYALTAAGVAIICGCIPAGLGVPGWISVVAGLAACWLIIRFVGKRTDDAAFDLEPVSAE